MFDQHVVVLPLCMARCFFCFRPRAIIESPRGGQ